MKHRIKMIVLFALIISLLPANVSATEHSDDIVYLRDGRYITIEISSIETRATQTRTATKTYTCSNDGIEEWRAVLTGTFVFNGTTSTCTYSNCTVTIADDAWYEISKNIGRSGNSATTDLTMGRKFLGITIQKETINMILTCDVNGNLT